MKQKENSMRIQINIDEAVNGWRLDIFEDSRYTVRENIERLADVFKKIDSWNTSKLSAELKLIKKSPTWEVI
jgi:hypothetical protein